MGLILDGTTGISASGNIYGGNVFVTGDFTPTALSVVGNVQGAYIKGNGSELTSVVAISASGTAATVTTAAQPNITSVGTLSSLSVTGNIDGGNVSGTNLTGSLTTAAQANITSVGTLTSLNVTGNISGGNVSGTNLSGSLTTAAQANITSVGTLTSLNVTGNIDGGNITSGIVSATGAIYGASGVFSAGLSVTGNITATGNLNYQNVTDLVVGDPLIYMGANNTSNLVDLGFVASANVSDVYQHLGFVRNHTNGVWGLFGNVVAEPTTVIDWANAVYQPFQSGDITTTTITATGNIVGGNVSGTNLTGSLTTAAQANITSVGTLSSLYVSGAISVGGGIVNTAGNATSNIGGTGAYFNTVFAKATSALYADLAEKYSADAEYAPGTVVSFGGTSEVTKSTTNGDRRVAGVVSTNPSYIMNSGLTGTVATVALTGRVPTSVTGRVQKGDLMVSNGDGSARAEENPQVGAVIGKALENFDGETGTIEVVVGRL